MDLSIGTRINSVISSTKLRLSLSANPYTFLEFTAGDCEVAIGAEAEAEAEAGAAILKPEDNFLITWEYPRIFEELSKNSQESFPTTCLLTYQLCVLISIV